MGAASVAHNRRRDPRPWPAARAPEALGSERRALLDAVMAISSDLDLHNVLGRIVESAVTLTHARYGALGVLGPRGLPGEFLTTGLTTRTNERDRRPPARPRHPRAVDHRPAADPVADLNQHPASFGFPPHHPPMGSFLGVPVRIRGTVFGNLYLTEKEGGGTSPRPTSSSSSLSPARPAWPSRTPAPTASASVAASGSRQRRPPDVSAAPGRVGPACEQIAATARRVGRSRATAVVDPGRRHVRALACEPMRRRDEAKPSALVLDEGARPRGQPTPVDVVVDDIVASVVPLRVQLAGRAPGLVLRRRGAALRDVDDRDLLRQLRRLRRADPRPGAGRRRARGTRRDLRPRAHRARPSRRRHPAALRDRHAAAGGRHADRRTRSCGERLDGSVADARRTPSATSAPPSSSFRRQAGRVPAQRAPRPRPGVRPRSCGFSPSCASSGPSTPPSTDSLREPLLKVLREALSNVARHAQATRTSRSRWRWPRATARPHGRRRRRRVRRRRSHASGLRNARRRATDARRRPRARRRLSRAGPAHLACAAERAVRLSGCRTVRQQPRGEHRRLGTALQPELGRACWTRSS